MRPTHVVMCIYGNTIPERLDIYNETLVIVKALRII